MAFETQSHTKKGPQPPACRITAPVDLVHLSRRTLGDRTLEREVLSLFVRQCDVYLERLHCARDGEARRCAAHALAGSAQAVGAFSVAREAFAVEEGRPDCAGLDDAVGTASAYVNGLLAETH